MPHISHRVMGRECLRLFSFTRPYWKTGVVALGFMVLYTMTVGAQLALIKPVLDRFSEKETRLVSSPLEGTQTETQDTPPRGLEEGLKKSLRDVAYIKGLKAWVGTMTSSYTNIGILALILAPIIFLSNYFQNYLKHFIIWRVYVDISNRLCESLLPQSLSFYDNRKSGDLLSRVINDLQVTQTGLIVLFGDVVLQPMRLLCGLGLALYFSWKLFLLALIALPFFLLPITIFGKKIRKHGEATLERKAQLTEALREMLAGIRIVKAYKMENEESHEFQRINEEFFRRRMKVNKAVILNESTNEAMYAVGLGIIVIIGGYVISTGNVGLGEFGGFIAASTLTFRSTKLLSRSYSRLQEALAGAGRIFELLDHEPQIKDHPQAVELKGMEKEVAFKNVDFAYDRTDKVLSDINFTVKKGQVVAIAGESGSGKSTLLNLIPRFYEPSRGTVEIDGQDVRYLKRDSLLNNIAIVTQQTFLFNKSIAENIRYGKRDASQMEVEAAAKAAYIHNFVSTLPKGYDTEVGELGVRLSGGQRQRIAIARAILKNAPILILDEATSALDSESEKIVQDALRNLMKGRTTFIVAHRLSTVRHCDKIAVLKEGRIVETGMHDELVQKGGEYRRLYQMQIEGDATFIAKK
ncbi:MAG: ABC transporter ATP-binding protein [Candidatus Brocadiales bacterium]